MLDAWPARCAKQSSFELGDLLGVHQPRGNPRSVGTMDDVSLRDKGMLIGQTRRTPLGRFYLLPVINITHYIIITLFIRYPTKHQLIYKDLLH